MALAHSDTPNLDDESHDLEGALRPVIQETIRTQTCRPGAKYLVDKITVATQERDGKVHESLRLWLSDGANAIQGILNTQAHPFVISGEVCEGSYVTLVEYELLRLVKASGEGYVWLLAISDLRTEGHDGRSEADLDFEEILSRREQPTPVDAVQGQPGADQNSHVPQPDGSGSDTDDNVTVAVEPTISTPGQTTAVTTPKKRKMPEDTHALSSLDPNVPGSHDRGKKRLKRSAHEISPPKKTLDEQTTDLRARLMALQSTPTKQRIRAATATPSPSPTKQAKLSKPSPRQAQTMPAPKPSPLPSSSQKPINRPLRITPLAHVTGTRATRNTIHDCLAIITHVNPRLLTRKGFPDSREILIMDCSTTKQVHLTVFVNAEKFVPEPGTVALFRSLTSHEWNGGSLKAYPQRCAGRLWFIPETEDWQWAEEADALRNCLAERPEARSLPDRIWWTERGQHKRA